MAAIECPTGCRAREHHEPTRRLPRAAVVGLTCLLLSGGRPAQAQHRPLVTQDPETIGAGHLLVEAGVEYRWDQRYPASGLQGDLWRVPVVGISVGAGSIVELQFDGGFNHLSITQRVDAPISQVVEVTADSTSDVEDLVVGTKVRMVGETAGHPAVGVLLATRLPMASNERGLGLDTTDFFVSLLVGKTTASIRLVANVGLGILGSPTQATEQNDVLTYGLSFARAIASRVEVVGEANGRFVTRSGTPPPGTEDGGLVRVGIRYAMGAGRVDAAVLIGLGSNDPGFGVTAGYTHVFNAFRVP